MQTFEEKVDAAMHAALHALGLSQANNEDTADLLRDAISNIAGNVVTSDFDDDDGN